MINTLKLSIVCTCIINIYSYIYIYLHITYCKEWTHPKAKVAGLTILPYHGTQWTSFQLQANEVVLSNENISTQNFQTPDIQVYQNRRYESFIEISPCWTIAFQQNHWFSIPEGHPQASAWRILHGDWHCTIQGSNGVIHKDLKVKSFKTKRSNGKSCLGLMNFGRGTLPYFRGLTNHGNQPLSNWDDPPSIKSFMWFNVRMFRNVLSFSKQKTISWTWFSHVPSTYSS